MFDSHLFLGFPVDPFFAAQVEKVNPHLLVQYISNSDDQLREIIYQEMRFFGKMLGRIASLDQLELLEANIYSVLRKLVPDYPYSEVSLYVFPIEQSEPT